MPAAKDFFGKEEQQQIIRAIQLAEGKTSGEIRVHLDDKLKGNILDRAAEIFRKLNMHETAARNGVLIFIVPSEKQFAIIGDEGIHQHVKDDFWEDVRNEMQIEFSNGRILQAVLTGIEKAGDKLKTFFPLNRDDKNELSDELSFE